MTFTSGEISFGKRRKTGDFEWEEASARFHFDKDSAPDIELASEEGLKLAKQRVYEALGLKIINPSKAAKPKATVIETERTEPIPVKADKPAEDDPFGVDTSAKPAKVEEPKKAAPKPTTQADLYSACNHRAKELGKDGSVKIRELVKKFSADGKLAGLPVEKYDEFLAELKVLQ
jgi:hypothetical protein